MNRHARFPDEIQDRIWTQTYGHHFDIPHEKRMAILEEEAARLEKAANCVTWVKYDEDFDNSDEFVRNPIDPYALIAMVPRDTDKEYMERLLNQAGHNLLDQFHEVQNE